MTPLQINRIKRICYSNVNKIFKDLAKLDLIDKDSKFYLASKKHVYNTCFQCLYPILEFFKYDKYHNFVLKNTELFVYSYFLDEALDSTKVPSRIAQSTQIASLLLIKYHAWLCNTYDDKIVSLFLSAYRKNSRYCVLEKKWDFPESYLHEYGKLEEIHQKCILLLFPIYYLLDNVFEETELINLKRMFTDYYSYNLLVDDIRDLDSDINNKCLTYPIIQYIKLTGRYPEKTEDLEILHPTFIEELSILYRKVYASNHLNKNFSKIIDKKLAEKNKLIAGGE